MRWVVTCIGLLILLSGCAALQEQAPKEIVERGFVVCQLPFIQTKDGRVIILELEKCEEEVRKVIEWYEKPKPERKPY